eukprot:6346085-Amphidinium_carterae.1
MASMRFLCVLQPGKLRLQQRKLVVPVWGAQGAGIENARRERLVHGTSREFAYFECALQRHWPQATQSARLSSKVSNNDSYWNTAPCTQALSWDMFSLGVSPGLEVRSFKCLH